MKKERNERIIGIDEMIGIKIRTRRIMLGLTQKQVADSIGVSLQQIQKYENLRNRISAGKLFVLAEFLKTPLAYFYNSDINDGESIINNMIIKDQENCVKRSNPNIRELFLLLRKFNIMKNSQRKIVVQLVRSMSTL
jgi:transcriptional regulator with XRE-family HTH domain